MTSLEQVELHHYPHLDRYTTFDDLNEDFEMNEFFWAEGVVTKSESVIGSVKLEKDSCCRSHSIPNLQLNQEYIFPPEAQVMSMTQMKVFGKKKKLDKIAYRITKKSTVDAPISALPNSAQAPISARFLGYQLFLCSKSPQ